MDKSKILNRLTCSEINRPVEIAFFEDTLNFSALSPYSAAIRYIDESEFYIAVQLADQSKGSATDPPADNALKGKFIKVLPLDASFEVEFSFNHPDFGHLLGFSNSGVHPRRFLRVAFEEKIYATIINSESQSEKEEIEVYALNLSGSGIAIRCRRGSGLTCGVRCKLKIANADFPGYDPSQGAAILDGQVVRVFSDEHTPDWENLGIELIFNDAYEELVQANLIDKFCRQIASLPEDQGNKSILEILDLIANLNTSLDIDTILFKINASAASLVSSEGSSILLFDDDNQKLNLYFKTATGDKAPILNRVHISRDTGGIAWWVAQTGEPTIANDAPSDPRFTGSVDNTTHFITKSLLAVPIVFEGEVLGVLEAVNKIGDAKFTQIDLQLFTALANQLAIVIKNAQMVGKYENFFTNAIELIVKAIESVGTLIGLMSQGHCWRVAAMATAIGQQFGISEMEFDNLYYGAVLHDIGLLEPQNQTLFQFDTAYNADNYTTEETIKCHPILGANMIKEIRMLQDATPIIRHHHERFDGLGYPDGLTGENIPLGARIVAVIELHEEILYGQEDNSAAQEQAIAAIRSGAGTRFDPQVVEVFINQIAQSH